jgi:hypothetical protein
MRVRSGVQDLGVDLRREVCAAHFGIFEVDAEGALGHAAAYDRFAARGLLVAAVH